MNVVHTIIPHVAVNSKPQITGSQASIYQAANFEEQAFSLVDPASLAAKTQNATDERAANQTLKLQATALVIAIDKRDAELEKQTQAEERNAMDDFANQHGYANWKAMSDKHNPPAKPSETITAQASNSSTSKHAPKVFKHVLRSDAKNLTADDEPGYIRLPKEQQESGKYREATAIEIAKFKSDLEAWETKHGSAKKP